MNINNECNSNKNPLITQLGDKDINTYSKGQEDYNNILNINDNEVMSEGI